MASSLRKEKKGDVYMALFVQKLLKEPDEAAVKKNPEAVQSVLEELVKAGIYQLLD